MADDASTKLLILDLDETLVFASGEPLDRPHDFVAFDYFVYRRPHLDRFLAFCLDSFRVAVWTSSGTDYAATVVEQIFPPGAALEFVWARPRCTICFDPEARENYWVKPLKKVRRLGYPLERVIVVDDTARKHERNYGNLVRVSEYTGDPGDDELLLLERYLERLDREPNVRAVEKRWWKASVKEG